MSRDGIARVDFYFDDWLSGTFEMSAELRGVFITVCSLIWKTRNRLQDDGAVLARWNGMSVRRWNALRAELIECGKIRIDDGFIRQVRAENELKMAEERREKAREKGAKGGEKKAENLAKSLAENETAPSSAKAEGVATNTNTLSKKKETPTGVSKESAPQQPVEHRAPAAEIPEQAVERPSSAARRPAQSRGSRITPDWKPAAELIEYARKEGLTDADISRETERFRNYYLGAAGQRALKSDWAATWQNWVLKAADDRRGAAPRGGGSGGGGSGHGRADRPRGLVANSVAFLNRRNEMAGPVH